MAQPPEPPTHPTTPPTTPPPLFTDDYWDQAALIDAAHQAQSGVVCATLPDGVTVWVINRYDHAREALTDPRLSKDSRLLASRVQAQLRAAGRDEGPADLFGPTMLFSDGPAHARLRNLVSRRFSRGHVQAMRAQIEHITDQLLDGLATTTPVDLISAFAFPLPLTVFGT